MLRLSTLLILTRPEVSPQSLLLSPLPGLEKQLTPGQGEGAGAGSHPYPHFGKLKSQGECVSRPFPSHLDLIPPNSWSKPEDTLSIPFQEATEFFQVGRPSQSPGSHLGEMEN